MIERLVEEGCCQSTVGLHIIGSLGNLGNHHVGMALSDVGQHRNASVRSIVLV